ncbi:DUF951 domain-containing protein [Pseudoramibacter sp.]|jgi:hypothetical protein|uniref:DUF951 domain-containing protein n=1 Tax=Pseudoramibacter sp. TaxID=2034862 RepID=UPI0025E987A2|nr:DUF951 domain-containing protein [Pseudoramibacter sp.]MCH4071930.1 DUF951 domain-containing protein [Pseudoramibacter sp.]MCH4105698.1 DUF951 domain-containing protein [Pseudoramibacter sp.]
MTDMPFKPGDIVAMKKGHPCGENRWEILHVGMDVRMKCTKCSRVVVLSRKKFKKMFKKKLEALDS